MTWRRVSWLGPEQLFLLHPNSTSSSAVQFSFARLRHSKENEIAMQGSWDLECDCSSMRGGGGGGVRSLRHLCCSSVQVSLHCSLVVCKPNLISVRCPSSTPYFSPAEKARGRPEHTVSDNLLVMFVQRTKAFRKKCANLYFKWPLTFLAWLS